MKTEARCPTCGFPFSFWKVAFAHSPFSIYCKNCGWRIVITADKSIMWATIAVLALISLVLFRFIVPRNLPRFVLLSALWVVCFYTLEIIVALMIVNWAQFSKPPLENEEEIIEYLREDLRDLDNELGSRKEDSQ